MWFFNNTSLKNRLLNPLLQVRLRKTIELVELGGNIHPYCTMVTPYLRLFFQGISDDSRCKDFYKALEQGSYATFDRVCTLFAFWFMYSLDRTVLMGKDNLLEDPKIKGYFSEVWIFSENELRNLQDEIDDAKIEERFLVFSEQICGELNNKNLLACLMINCFVHACGSLKLVLTLEPEVLMKLS